MAELCVPCFSHIIITTPGIFKKSKPEEIYAVFTQAAHGFSAGSHIHFIPDTKNAIEKTKELALELGLPILGTGSFYLAAEIRKLVVNNN